MSDDHGSADLAEVEARQLETWAFGRQGGADPELATAALRELARRSALERTATTTVPPNEARDDGAVDDADGEHPELISSPAQTAHKRRMLLTGLAGLTAAVFGLGVANTALSVPDPDPLAIFERPTSQQDRDWETRLVQDYIVAVTQGPRVIDVADGVVAVAFRSSAVADGRSTEYDPYCLFTSEQSEDGAPISLGGGCVLPERFDVEGIVLPFRESASGVGLDTVRWGPTGAPVYESGGSFESIGGVSSALDWMVFPSFAVSGAAAVAIVTDPDRLLLGPTVVPMSTDDEAAAAILTSAYLLRGETDSAGPVLCAHAAVPVLGDTTSCAPLSTVRRQGLEFTVTTTDREWIVSIGADGPDRSDTIRAAD